MSQSELAMMAVVPARLVADFDAGTVKLRDRAYAADDRTPRLGSVRPVPGTSLA